MSFWFGFTCGALMALALMCLRVLAVAAALAMGRDGNWNPPCPRCDASHR